MEMLLQAGPCRRRRNIAPSLSPLLQKNVAFLTSRVEALADVATDWCDPDHPPRSGAVQDTLEASNRWTEQALTHAMNRWMQRLTVEGLTSWLGEEALSSPNAVGVLHADTGPLSGLRDAIAVWGLGYAYVGHLPESSPSILPAFAEEVAAQYPDLQICFLDEGALYKHADAVLAQPGESDEAIREACDENDIPPKRRLLRSPVYSVGVVDGHESEDEMERMAEDMLLFEGMGRRRLALLWAPRDHPPDAYLKAMARFRGLFPAHPDTPGTLQMKQAFLEARDEPHAYADGLEFLMSRGDPSPQRSGHIRWTEYDDLADVKDWIDDHEEEVHAIIARRHLHDQLPDERRLRTPGGVYIPPLDDEEGQETVAFLRSLKS